MAEELQYDIQTQADVADISKVIGELKELADKFDAVAEQEEELAKEANEAADALEDTEKEAKKLGRALEVVAGLGIAGIVQNISSAFMAGVGSVNRYTSEVNNMANQLAIGLEEASAFQASFRLSGMETEAAMGAISSFQGRLIGELEAQADAKKELAAIDKERGKVLADLADAEADYEENIAALEQRRAALQDDGTAARLQKRDQELAQAARDYNRFLEESRQAEEAENARFADIWKDRMKEYQRQVEDARADLEDKNRRARNFREFMDNKEQFAKQQSELSEKLADDKAKHDKSLEERLGQIEAQRQKEREMYEQRSADIAAAADRDVAKLRQANQEALADVEERMQAERDAIAEARAETQEELVELAVAQSEVEDSAGGLSFVMDELGVKLFDAQGKMRPVNEVLWEMKDALASMPDSARKAAIISDLGWEDLASWINNGADATEALQFAQENNLVVTQDMVDKVGEQNRAMAEAQLKVLGMMNTIMENGEVMDMFIGALGKVNDLLSWMKDSGAVEAVGDGIRAIGGAMNWAAEQFVNASSILVDLINLFDDLVEAAKKASPSELFQAGHALADGLNPLNLGKEFGKNLNLPGFATGGFVPGDGPVPIMAHGGEYVMSRNEVARSGPGTGGATVNINAPVYGVTDLQKAIHDALSMGDRMPDPVGVR